VNTTNLRHERKKWLLIMW